MLEIRSPALKTESFSCHAHPRMNGTSKGAWLGRSLKCTIYIAMHHLHNDEQPSSACSSSNRAAAARSTTAEPSTLDVVGKRHVLRPAISLSCKLAAARVQRQQLQEVMYIYIYIYIYVSSVRSSVHPSVRPSVGGYAYEYVYVYLYIIYILKCAYFVYMQVDVSKISMLYNGDYANGHIHLITSTCRNKELHVAPPAESRLE